MDGRPDVRSGVFSVGYGLRKWRYRFMRGATDGWRGSYVVGPGEVRRGGSRQRRSLWTTGGGGSMSERRVNRQDVASTSHMRNWGPHDRRFQNSRLAAAMR